MANSFRRSGSIPSVSLANGYSGIPVLGIEVTQAIQDMAHNVTLIAGKTTVVRVYVEAASLASAAIITGEIAWSSDGGNESYLPALNVVNLNPFLSFTLSGQRDEVGASLNFLLPIEATQGTTLTLRVNRLLVVGGADMPIQDAEPRTVAFQFMPPLLVRIIGLRYLTQAGDRFISPSAIDFAYFRSYLQRAYPVAAVEWSHIVVDSDLRPPFDNDSNSPVMAAKQANMQVAAIRSAEMNAGFHPRTHYLGLVHDDNMVSFMVGYAIVPPSPQPEVVGSAPCGMWSGYHGDVDASYADWYGAHELSHTFGRNHPGFPTGAQNIADPNYPHRDGLIGSFSADFVGFDVGDPALGLPMRALPNHIWHDFMTYADNLWLSAYTYEAIRLRLIDEAQLHPAEPTLSESEEIPFDSLLINDLLLNPPFDA